MAPTLPTGAGGAGTGAAGAAAAAIADSVWLPSWLSPWWSSSSPSLSLSPRVALLLLLRLLPPLALAVPLLWLLLLFLLLLLPFAAAAAAAGFLVGLTPDARRGDALLCVLPDAAAMGLVADASVAEAVDAVEAEEAFAEAGLLRAGVMGGSTTFLLLSAAADAAGFALVVDPGSGMALKRGNV